MVESSRLSMSVPSYRSNHPVRVRHGDGHDLNPSRRFWSDRSRYTPRGTQSCWRSVRRKARRSGLGPVREPSVAAMADGRAWRALAMAGVLPVSGAKATNETRGNERGARTLETGVPVRRSGKDQNRV
jgi:hypothetical protein